MINDLLGKIKNKPDEAQTSSSSDHVPDRVDMLMEQVKNLIEINKTLNGKVKAMESQFSALSQTVVRLNDQAQQSAGRMQSFEQVILKCTQLLQRLQQTSAPTPTPRPVSQPISVPVQSSIPTSTPVPPVPASFVVDDLLSNAPRPKVQTEAAPGNYFVLKDGRQLKNLREVFAAFQTLSDEEFKLYVNDYKNDVANWVRFCLNSPLLANELAKVRTRMETLKAIQPFL